MEWNNIQQLKRNVLLITHDTWTNLKIIIQDVKEYMHLSGCLGMGAVRTSGEVLQRDSRKLCGIIVSWVYTYVQTYENVHFNYVKFTVYHLYLNKTFLKRYYWVK